MAITIPASDVPHTNLNARIANIATEITNVGTANGPLAAKLAAMKVQAQHDLVLSLLGSGHLSAASVLSSATYVNGPAIS